MTNLTLDSTQVVGRMLAGPGSAGFALPDTVRLSERSTARTTGFIVEPVHPAVAATPSSAGAAIGELRRLSGLTWDQLARIFDVSRRSLHFWASGKAMEPSKEEHLQRVLAVLRTIDRGTASANRSALLGECADGSWPIDLLAARDYQRVRTLLGQGAGRRQVSLPKLSAEARAARAPRPPAELVGALQDRVHPTSGRLLAAKPITTTRRK